MAQFAEELLKEYPPIIKRTTFTKDVSYRIRVVRRKVDGIMRTLVDIREYIVNEKRAIFTESGVYFNLEELEVIIKDLTDARREYGLGTRSGGKDTFNPSKEK